MIDYAQPIYVCREDPASRHKTIQDIIDRANSKENWPQVNIIYTECISTTKILYSNTIFLSQILVFPEGTCTNRKGLIQFKPGAFYPGVPVQPICNKK